MAVVGFTPEKKDLKHYKKNQLPLIERYISANPIRKMQIGAQSNSVEGWLNVDISPKEASVCYMDATQTFPISNETFDYVFSEHMIEHIDFDDAAFMLQECYRILKPGGKIRIATPDLEVVAKLLTTPDETEYKAYIEHYHKRFFPNKPCKPAFVINKLFYSFHHRFIHNVETLEYLLNHAGFKNCVRCEVGKSDDPGLQNLEQHWREMGEIPNRVETLVVEGEK